MSNCLFGSLVGWRVAWLHVVVCAFVASFVGLLERMHARACVHSLINSQTGSCAYSFVQICACSVPRLLVVLFCLCV